MKQTIAVAIALAIALLGHASAADKRRTCSGEFTEMITIGTMIGNCEINDISEADRQYVRHRCGDPWTRDKSESMLNAPTCTITVIAGTRKPNEHGALVYPVRRVLRR